MSLKLNLKKKKIQEKSKEEIKLEKSKKSSEEWVDRHIKIDDDFIQNKKGEYVLLFKVEAISFNLLSEDEKKMKIKNLAKLLAFMGELPFGFYVKNKKVKNLDSYLSILDEKIIKEQNHHKKMIMHNEIKHVLSLKKNKKISEKEYYLYVLSSNKERLKELKERLEVQEEVEMKKISRIQEIKYLCGYFDQEYIGRLEC